MGLLTKINVGYGLYILSAKENNKENACIINTFLQVTSGVSPSCVITVSKENLTHSMVMNTNIFNLSVLAAEATFDIFERFGYQTGRNVDKFSGYESHIQRSKNGLIYTTQNTNAFMSFVVMGTMDFETHTMFTAQPVESKVLSEVESVTYNYYQKHIKPKPRSMKAAGYRCIICNYVYEGENLPLDYICPICKHGVNEFVIAI